MIGISPQETGNIKYKEKQKKSNSDDYNLWLVTKEVNGNVACQKRNQTTFFSAKVTKMAIKTVIEDYIS